MSSGVVSTEEPETSQCLGLIVNTVRCTSKVAFMLYDCLGFLYIHIKKFVVIIVFVSCLDLFLSGL